MNNIVKKIHKDREKDHKNLFEYLSNRPDEEIFSACDNCRNKDKYCDLCNFRNDRACFYHEQEDY